MSGVLMYGAAAVLTLAVLRGIKESERYRKGKKVTLLTNEVLRDINDESVERFLDDIGRIRIPNHDEFWPMLYEVYTEVMKSPHVSQNLKESCRATMQRKGARWVK